MKEEPSLKKQGSLVFRMLLTISIVLVVIVLAGGVLVIKRMRSWPEPQPKSVVVQAKVPPLPLPASEPEPTKVVNSDLEDVDQQNISDPEAKTRVNAQEEATPAEPAAPVEVVAEKEEPADQDTVTPADANVETAPTLPAATDMPEESQAQEADLAVQDAPAPVEPTPGQDAPKPPASADSEKSLQDEPAALSSESNVQKGFAIQVASFRKEAYAKASMNELKQKGYHAFIHQTTDQNQCPWYAVRFGHFENMDDANEFLVKFNTEENTSAIVIYQK